MSEGGSCHWSRYTVGIQTRMVDGPRRAQS